MIYNHCSEDHKQQHAATNIINSCKASGFTSLFVSEDYSAITDVIYVTDGFCGQDL